MSTIKLVYRYLTDKMLSTTLNVVLLSLGIAVIFILLSVGRQMEEKINSNSRGIDLVVGAKGSPLQLILCSIFHVDFPTGNIKLHDADNLAQHRLIKLAIPLSMGDNFQGYRIVGTTRAYADLYKGELATGDWFNKPMDVVVGVNVAERAGLHLGATFASSHGLSGAGEEHGTKFIVTGEMKRTNTVLDNLILTPLESVWEVHHHEGEDESEEHEVEDDARESIAKNPYKLVPSVDRSDTTKEVTSLLIQFRNPIAAIQLPRYINGSTNMQAASPAFETARLFSILGVGVDVIAGFAAVLVLISGLSIFIVLYNAMRERRYDLAIMRTMGASRATVFSSLVLEGAILTLTGSIVGLLIGHLSLYAFVQFIPEGGQIGLQPFMLLPGEAIVLAGSVGLGVICSLLPAMQAYRLNIHHVLAGN